MQRYDPMERLRQQFRLQQLQLRFRRAVPELPVKVVAVARVTCPVLESGRITDRKDEQAITGGQLRFGLQQLQESDQRMHPLRLIAMNAGKYTKPDGIVATLWADEQVARQF